MREDLTPGGWGRGAGVGFRNFESPENVYRAALHAGKTSLEGCTSNIAKINLH